MRQPFFRYIGVLGFVTLIAGPVAGQTAAKPQTGAAAKAVARTADGQPDLQGVWDFRTVTPMERPKELGDKAVLTAQEAAEYEKKTVASRDADANRSTAERARAVNGTAETEDVALAYNNFWWDRGTKVVGSLRTSLIVDPPNGLYPPLTPEGQKRLDRLADVRERPAVGPEDRAVGERCILGFNSGPPMVPAAYNMNVQIVQAPGYVVLLNEMVHNARIIPMDGRPHLDKSVRQWVGDSRGRWEGNTLVIDTTNYSGETAFRGSSPNLHLIERFTRDGDSLLYEFTVEDPTTWTRPFTVQIPMLKSNLPIYEYACHEGNYGMFGILSGARAVEKRQIDAAKGGSQ